MAIWAEIEPRTQERRGRLGKWAAGAWIEIALCFVAVFGLGSTLLGDFQKVREFDYVATDYKTLYASSALYREGGNPYDAPALMAIYHRDGVVLPRTTFGRMPVYPPPTLLVLWPLTYLPMGASADAWWVVSMAVTAAALAMLVGEARRQGLNWLYRLGLIAFTVASPMLGYTFNIGNVSPTVGALCTIALMLAVRESQAGAKAGTTAWLTAGGCLGLALCLKPHMAVWIAAGIALVGGRSGRRIAAVGVALFGGCTVLSMALVWSRGALHMVLGSFLAMLAQERASGSMSAESRELLPVLGQLTGLDSLLGLHVGQPLQGWLVGAALAACFGVLLVMAWRRRWWSRDPAWQALYVTAIFATGMLASYHRAHDAVLLAGLDGLWICHAIREARRDGRRRWLYAGASAVILCIFGGQWFALPSWICERAATSFHAPWLADLLALRQGAAVAACLAVVLIVLVDVTGKLQKKTARTVYCPCREASDATCVGR